MQKLAVVVPTYNEKDNIGVVAHLLAEVAKAMPVVVEVIVVDDSSPDGTGELAEALGRELNGGNFEMLVLSRAVKDGLGRAYIAGFKLALERGADFICEMDADLSHPAAKLSEMLAKLQSAGFDFAIGSRYVKDGGVQNWSIFRQILSRAGSLYARIMLGVNIQDFTGGFNMFKREVLEKLDLAAITSSGYSFQIELKYRAIQAGFKFVEVPILFVDRVQGESKMSGKIVTEAMRKVWQLRFGK